MKTPSPPPPGAVNPAGLENLEAEKRAEERRAREQKEKEKAEEAARAADEQAKLEASKAAIAAEELRKKVGPLRSELEKIVEQGRKDIEQRRKQLNEEETLLGDLQGSIITAGDLAKIDPQRAIDTLQRAKDRLRKAN